MFTNLRTLRPSPKAHYRPTFVQFLFRQRIQLLARCFHIGHPRHWIEWQANYFASSFILPRGQFQAKLWQIQDLQRKTRGKILLDDSSRQIKSFYEIVNKLAYHYHISKTTIIYKLYEMELINNQSRLKLVGQLVDEYTDGNIT